ncbi:GNAT family N-acetyltransferase [Flavobacteriales bacterium]|nr:GNAT family N-acetyltransferase [Flavobacteriales bacterium]MDC1352766.1 GNAT family N-acetyltransferase [Flavobacteriales bacterium]|tara:strand:- start:196 stop:672 length:477 start_codon:yes stop_codon:yes gene_type:complete
MKTILRKATKQDLQGTLDLVNELALYEKAPQEVTVTLADYETDFDNNVFDILIAEQENQIVGIAFYYMAYSTWKGKMLYLEDFVVKEELRGHGIGKLLFKAYLEEAKKLNVSLAKWQVLDWNEPAINFYEKYNSTIEKEWFNGKILSKDFEGILELLK